jgi:hypothetical protein
MVINISSKSPTLLQRSNDHTGHIDANTQPSMIEAALTAKASVNVTWSYFMVVLTYREVIRVSKLPTMNSLNRAPAIFQ